jgi:hypothetical protein
MLVGKKNKIRELNSERERERERGREIERGREKREFMGKTTASNCRTSIVT